MPKATPQSVKQEVVQLYLEGYNQEGIVKKRVVKSLGNVSNILRDFRRECELDIVAAAEKYGVKETIERTHGLNAELIETKLSLEEAKEGLEFLPELKETGTELEDLKDFVRKLVKAAEKYGIEIIVKHAQKLYELEQETGKTYEKLLADFEEKGEQIEGLLDQRKRLEEEKKAAEKSTAQALQVAKTTKEEISDYTRDRGLLSKYGLKVSDTQTIAAVFENIKDHDEDYKRIIRTVKETEKIAKELVRVNDELGEREEELKSLSLQIETYRRSQKEFVKLSELGLTFQSMQKLNEIAKKHDTPGQFLSNLYRAYELHDGILGLEGQNSKLESMIQTAEVELAKILAEKQTTLNVVVTIASLRKDGVGADEILTIHKISEKHGSGFLREVVEKSITVKLLEADLAKLQSGVAELTKQTNELEGGITQKRKSLTLIGGMVDDMSKTVKKAQTDVTEVIKKVKTKFEDLSKDGEGSFQKMSTAVNSFEVETKQKLTSMADEVTKLQTAALEAGRSMGALETLAPLIDLISKMEGDPEQVHVVMRLILQKYSGWLDKQQKPNLEFKGKLGNLIGSIPIK